jgi:hypothetical protein
MGMPMMGMPNFGTPIIDIISYFLRRLGRSNSR